MNIYEIPIQNADGTTTTLAEYRGRVLLIVNVASKCGFTPQYAGLEALHRKYKDRCLVVLGFPCNQFMHQEPGNAGEIQQFCKLKYDVTFPIFAKIDVNGANASPLYQHLKSQRRGLFWLGSIKWNFTKFLVDRQGNVAVRYGAFKKPKSLESSIERLLK